MSAIVNIGLDIGNRKNALTKGQVLKALKSQGTSIIKSAIKQSASERTAVVEINPALTKSQIESLCTQLSQEAIAQKVNGRGTLYGPKADEWGPFSDEYFLEFDAESFAFENINPRHPPLNPTRPSDDRGDGLRPKRPIRRPNRRPYNAEVLGYDIDNKTIGIVAALAVIGGWWLKKE